MQSTSQIRNDSANLHNQNDATVPSTSNLTITMTTQTKPTRRAKKQRAIERTEEVITEHLRYQPLGSSPIPDLQFEKQLFSVEKVPRSTSKQGQTKILAVSEDVLIGIGAFLEYTGRGGYNDLADRGGTSCQEIAAEQASNVFEAACVQGRQDDGMTPMGRFLREPGP
jgi:hypothetical protein